MLVTLDSRATPGLSISAIGAVPDSVTGALTLARTLGALPQTSLRDRWETLASIAAHDLGIARAIEPHLDAVDILDQAGEPIPSGAWGVFAAEGGDNPLTASHDGNWTLSGTKPWCSLADVLDAALVTATDGSGNRRLFAVDLSHHGVSTDRSVWVARGLTEIPSGSVRFDAVPARPIGEPGWYLDRPGFALGGIGVAACWFGGAVGIARTVHAASSSGSDPFLLAHLGAIDELLTVSRLSLADAASRPDPNPRLQAKRVRATIARACEEVILRAGHALGPAPLVRDAAHAKRVADLQLYIRQHHAERDLASLGKSLADEATPW